MVDGVVAREWCGSVWCGLAGVVWCDLASCGLIWLVGRGLLCVGAWARLQRGGLLILTLGVLPGPPVCFLFFTN